MSTPQTKRILEKRKEGLCDSCARPVYSKRKCFRCDLVRAFAKRGLSKYRLRSKAAWERFVVGMAARYTRILEDEGFAVDAIREPQEVIRLSGMTWATGRNRRKVLEVIAQYDDRAIRKRFS